jgi:hypothetical protein
MPSASTQTGPLSRENLAACTQRVLRPASGAKPAILLARSEGRLVVVKDFAHNFWLLRHLYGRWVVAHETKIYGRLGGVDGVPAFRGRLDAFAFAVDFVGGSTLKELPRKSVATDAFERLAALHREIHARGVVHLDSHQKKNILLTDDGHVHLVDFATSLYVGTGWLGRTVLVPLLGRADRLGLHKLRGRYGAEDPTPEEARRRRLVWTLECLWPPTALRRLRRRWRKRDLAQDDPGASQGRRRPEE